MISMQRFVAACLLALVVASLVPGCGGASGIQEGVPKEIPPLPKDFDPPKSGPT